MPGLLLALILTAGPGPSNDPGAPSAAEGEAADGAVTVYACRFERPDDENYDDWPDNWRRVADRDHPHYLEIGIVTEREGAEQENAALRIELNGSAAAAQSPPIPVSSQFSYVLEGRLRTRSLVHDAAFLSLTLLDSEGQSVGVLKSPAVTRSDRWQPIRLGPITPDTAEVRRAVIGVHLEPRERADLHGEAWFDDLRLVRLPRLSLTAASPHHLFNRPRDVRIDCTISGAMEKTIHVRLEVLDVDGRLVAEEEREIEAVAVQMADSAGQPLAGDGSASQTPLGYVATKTWRPSLVDYGFYRVRATIRGGKGTLMEGETTIAVLRPMRRAAEGEFGWSMNAGEQEPPLTELADLLAQVGVHWVKYPVWYEKGDVERSEQLAAFAERLSVDRLQLVGVLDLPPGADSEYPPPVASVFVDDELWRPLLDPVISRLSLKVRYWQLGGDGDGSFVGFPGLPEKISLVKKHMERFGQEVRLGIPWNWLQSPPLTADPPWQFQSKYIDPGFTSDELVEYLAGARPEGPVWVALPPLPKDKYDRETRIRDLILRMVSAKIEGADCAFIPDPFGESGGLMRAGGTPDELLVPWRTAAMLLSGAEHLGSLSLPGGSRNEVFSRGEETFLVIYNDQPTREVIYLGDDVRQIDVWGRERAPELEGHRQVIEAGPLPVFLVGANGPVARCRLSFAFDQVELASVFGRRQNISYRFDNAFGQGISGEVEVVAPPNWALEPTRTRFKLAGGQTHRESSQVLLGADAGSGSQPLRIDFEVVADRTYRFSVYRAMQVGLGDISIELSTRLDEQGNLVVRQQFVNNTDDTVNFNCLLFAPGRRRRRIQVIDLGRGREAKEFVLADGKELLGERLWLRAEELDGDRILNYHVTAER